KAESAETQRLTIRSMAPLSLVSETTIIAKRSPVLSGQFTKKTPERSLFKYMLSGVDDSALLSQAEDARRIEEKRQRVVAGRELVAARRIALAEAGHDEAALTDVGTLLEQQLAALRSVSGSADDALWATRRKRRRLDDLSEVAQNKLRE